MKKIFSLLLLVSTLVSCSSYMGLSTKPEGILTVTSQGDTIITPISQFSYNYYGNQYNNWQFYFGGTWWRWNQIYSLYPRYYNFYYNVYVPHRRVYPRPYIPVRQVYRPYSNNKTYSSSSTKAYQSRSTVRRTYSRPSQPQVRTNRTVPSSSRFQTRTTPANIRRTPSTQRRSNSSSSRLSPTSSSRINNNNQKL